MTDYINTFNIGKEIEVYNGSVVSWGTDTYVLGNKYVGRIVHLVTNPSTQQIETYLVKSDHTSIAEQFPEDKVFYGYVKNSTINPQTQEYTSLEIVRDDIPVGGSQFDGCWSKLNDIILYDGNIGAGTVRVINLSNSLPVSNNDYLIRLSIEAQTGTKAGNTVDVIVNSGSTTGGTDGYRVCRCVTRTNSYQYCAGTVDIPIKNSDKNFTINTTGANATGSYKIVLKAFKTLGTNETESHYIEKITTKDKTDIKLGNECTSGQPVFILDTDGLLLDTVTIASEASRTISLASILPNDGYDYECIFSSSGLTPPTSGNNIKIFLFSGSSTTTGWNSLYRVIARSNGTVRGGGNVRLHIPANDKNVTILNNGNASVTNLQLNIISYRRLGRNNPFSVSKIAYPDNTNGITIGGDIADGQYEYKFQDIYVGTFNALSQRTFTVSNYLPDNDNTYEVLFQTFGRTGTTSGNTCQFWVKSGLQTASRPLLGSYIGTRTASTTADQRFGVFYCKQDSNGNMTFEVNYTGNATSGSSALSLCAYRVLGTNE